MLQYFAEKKIQWNCSLTVNFINFFLHYHQKTKSSYYNLICYWKLVSTECVIDHSDHSKSKFNSMSISHFNNRIIWDRHKRISDVFKTKLINWTKPCKLSQMSTFSIIIKSCNVCLVVQGVSWNHKIITYKPASLTLKKVTFVFALYYLPQ